jgi:hypothetical protein
VALGFVSFQGGLFDLYLSRLMAYFDVGFAAVAQDAMVCGVINPGALHESMTCVCCFARNKKTGFHGVEDCILFVFFCAWFLFTFALERDK